MVIPLGTINTCGDDDKEEVAEKYGDSTRYN